MGHSMLSKFRGMKSLGRKRGPEETNSLLAYPNSERKGSSNWGFCCNAEPRNYCQSQMVDLLDAVGG